MLVALGVCAASASVQNGDALASAAAPSPAAAGLEVRVDERVELLCIVNRPAGAREYCQAPDGPYTRVVDERFGPFRDYAAVAATRSLRAESGISFDAPPSLAVH